MKSARLGLFLLALPISAVDLTLTPADLEMARQVIARNTMSMPGLIPGSRFDNGPGPFSAADAAVLLALKYHAQTKTCIPAATLEGTLAKLEDWDPQEGRVQILGRVLQHQGCRPVR